MPLLQGDLVLSVLSPMSPRARDMGHLGVYGNLGILGRPRFVRQRAVGSLVGWGSGVFFPALFVAVVAEDEGDDGAFGVMFKG